MSSSNEVRVALLSETEYGVTPDAPGPFLDGKFTSEALTGTPLTVESQVIRNDRQTNGQVATGLELGGPYNTELSNDPVQAELIEAAMYNDIVQIIVIADTITAWVPQASDPLRRVDITISNPSLFAEVRIGSIIILTGGGLDTLNEGAKCIVYGSDGTTSLKVERFDADFFDESANVPLTAVDFNFAAYWEIGIIEKSFSISKEFLDVDDGNVRSIAYRGMRVGSMSHTFNYGEIVTGVYTFGGNGYQIPQVPITDGYTITPASDAQSFDASNGMPSFLLDQATDEFNDDLADVCAQNLSYTLNNNLQPQTCIGELAPTDQVAFSAAVEISMQLYNGIQGFDALMLKKLSQDPIGLHWVVVDSDNTGYSFSFPRVQLNFPDPAATGRDEFVFLEAAGVASYSESAGNTMRVYQIT